MSSAVHALAAAAVRASKVRRRSGGGQCEVGKRAVKSKGRAASGGLGQSGGGSGGGRGSDVGGTGDAMPSGSGGAPVSRRSAAARERARFSRLRRGSVGHRGRAQARDEYARRDAKAQAVRGLDGRWEVPWHNCGPWELTAIAVA